MLCLASFPAPAGEGGAERGRGRGSGGRRESSGNALADDTTKDDTLAERIAAEAVLPMKPPNDLTSGVEPLDGRAILLQHAAVGADGDATHAVVDHGCNQSRVVGPIVREGRVVEIDPKRPNPWRRLGRTSKVLTCLGFRIGV